MSLQCYGTQILMGLNAHGCTGLYYSFLQFTINNTLNSLPCPNFREFLSLWRIVCILICLELNNLFRLHSKLTSPSPV